MPEGVTVRVKLRTKIAVLVLGVVAAFLCANVAWETNRKAGLEEAELVQQARALSSNMGAVWEFVNINQNKINYTSDGVFEFKGLQCSIVGRSVGALFSRGTDYSVRYVSDTPRNRADAPDDFEMEAIALFRSNTDITESYTYAYLDDGRRIFRYVTPMKLAKSCLDCHGEPKGEYDLSGYPREGFSEGYVYGALSMDIPTEVFEYASAKNSALNVGFSLLLIVGCVSILSLAISHLVTHPLARIRAAMEEVGEGSYSARLSEPESSLEIAVLSNGFNTMAAQLEQTHDHMEELVAERTEELERAYADLERANERLKEENHYRSDFLAMMSHELRTPLAASMAFADILREHSDPNADDDRLWREVENNHKTLLSLINNILAMARIDAGRETLRPELVDIADIVGLLQATIDPLADQKGVSVSYDIDDIPLFIADSEKLRRIVENLMSNAVKFTPTGGSVVFAAHHMADEHTVNLVVSDTGCGIPAESVPIVFDRFVQVDSSLSRSHGGSGLGLALVRELTLMHKGTVELRSEEGVGSSFTVRLPDNLPLIQENATDA